MNTPKAYGLEKPRLPESIGKAILEIAQGRASTRHFAKYPFVEDMISDGYENVVKYIDNFDFEKYNKPFSYFNMIIWRAFLRRIEAEKELLENKIKYENRINIFEDDIDENADYGFGHKQYIKEFLEKREETKRKRKEKREKNVRAKQTTDTSNSRKLDKGNKRRKVK